jgi:predicted RNA-binding protein Jag
MKSLVEEASSIAKAIEKAWDRAGKPQAFSVKIYETGEKNFLGFTKKSAKVGIFFEEEQPKSNDRRHHGQNNRPQHGSRPQQNTSYADRLERNAERSERPERAERSERSERSERAPRNHSSEAPRASTRPAQQPRPSYQAPEERVEVAQEVRQEPRERYVRERNEESPRRDNRRGGRPERRDGRRPQRSSQSEGSERSHREPLVQPYPHSENTEVERPVAQNAVEQSSERPVMGIPVAQTQRKVLKVSSRRYAGNKPAVEEPKKSE